MWGKGNIKGCAMRSDTIKRYLLAVPLAGQLLWPAISPAAVGDAETAGAGLEEIVVTATRRTERLQDVPISVTAFSQEKLDSQGLRNIDDLTRLSPGVMFQRNGNGSSANYNDENSDSSIRGIDSRARALRATGICGDDAPVQSRDIGFGAVNVFPALFDLTDRVPAPFGCADRSGTLFGAAPRAVVRFITPSPISPRIRARCAPRPHPPRAAMRATRWAPRPAVPSSTMFSAFGSAHLSAATAVGWTAQAIR
jgi:hypothetical protein